MSLTVLKPGFQETLQDLGRTGFTHLGISPAGTADSFSFRLGNLLVGNDENDAGLEMTLVGGTYRFNQNVSRNAPKREPMAAQGGPKTPGHIPRDPQQILKMPPRAPEGPGAAALVAPG